MHTALKDKNINVLLPWNMNEEQHNPHNIELDCAPGMTRPWHLIHGLIEGTGLQLSQPETDEDHSLVFFGAARYDFPNTTCEEWGRIQPVIKRRIKALYASGRIRFGSW
jgi:hypothetical protein